MADEDVQRSRFGLYIASSLVIILLMTLALPMAFSANKETAYSAYVTDADDEGMRLAQLNMMADSLGENGEDYFVHVYGLGPKLKNFGLRSGQKVLFDVEFDNMKGDKAVNVRPG